MVPCKAWLTDIAVQVSKYIFMYTNKKNKTFNTWLIFPENVLKWKGTTNENILKEYHKAYGWPVSVFESDIPFRDMPF